MSQERKFFNRYNKSGTDFVTPGMQLKYVAEEKPDEPAIIYVDAEHEERMTWRELHLASNRVANYLLSLGAGHGTSVIITYPNSIEHLVAAFGVWKSGACYVPLSCRTTKTELEQLDALLSCRIAFTDIPTPEGVITTGFSELYKTAAAYSDEMPPDTLTNPNIITASGGSTGKPKLIRQNIPCGHSDLSLSSWFEVSGMNFGQIQLMCGPLFHGAPHIVAFNGLYSGNTLVIPSTLCPDNLVSLIKRYRISYMQLVPTLMHRLIKLPGVKKEDFATLEALCHTGGVCSEWLKRAWLQILPPERVYEMYSMTEVIGMCAIRGDEWLKHPGSVGKPKYGGKISIHGPDGRELPPREVGEIFMSPPEGFFYTEYINADPLKVSQGGFRSVGDMGYVDEDGYLYFADRRIDMIVTGGENVFAAEVEDAILRHANVLDAVVVGIPDVEWGRRLHAVIESDAPIDPAELKSFLKQYLLPYKIPKSFEFVKRIKRKDSGKIEREAILQDCIARGV